MVRSIHSGVECSYHRRHGRRINEPAGFSCPPVEGSILVCTVVCSVARVARGSNGASRTSDPFPSLFLTTGFDTDQPLVVELLYTAIDWNHRSPSCCLNDPSFFLWLLNYQQKTKSSQMLLPMILDLVAVIWMDYKVIGHDISVTWINSNRKVVLGAPCDDPAD